MLLSTCLFVTKSTYISIYLLLYLFSYIFIFLHNYIVFFSFSNFHIVLLNLFFVTFDD